MSDFIYREEYLNNAIATFKPWFAKLDAPLLPRAPETWHHALRADMLGVVYLLHNEARYVVDQYTNVLDFLAHPGKLASLRPSRELRRYAHGEV